MKVVHYQITLGTPKGHKAPGKRRMVEAKSYVGQTLLRPSASISEFAKRLRQYDTAPDITIQVWDENNQIY